MVAGALTSKELETLKKASEELMTASHKIAEEVYKQAAAKGKEGEQTADAGKAKAEEPVDAEYKVEDEGK